ncbi:hypothetical protein ACS0TY_032581 [Phlomoides rotata]
MDLAAYSPIFSSLHSISTLKTPPFIANHPTNLVYKSPILLNRSTTASTSRSIAVVVNGDVSAITSDPDITWQILIGALAGVIPFVVAGIEFSKRIVEQRNCKVCKGSGLVLRDGKYYFRCPRCGMYHVY